MKKVLFVLQSANVGGTATSLFNLLSLWESKDVEADLFLLEQKGPLLSRAKSFRLLSEEKVISSVLCSKMELGRKGLFSKLIRYSFVLAHRLFGAKKATRWFYRHSAKRLSNKYDVVVAYQESLVTEYVQYINAPRRVAWCHTAYEAFSGNKSLEEQRQLYDAYDMIACVSENGKQSLMHNLHLSAEKIQVVRNTVPAQHIRDLATVEGEIIETRDLTLVSCGRFAPVKRFDRVIEAARAMRSASLEFIWYVIGDGAEYKRIESLIHKYDLQDYVILTGALKNPFRHIGKADCFVMTSESEGQPMVLNEALTLGVPIVTTDFPSSRETVIHEVNSLIAPNTNEGLTETVMRFACDESIRDELVRGAATFVYKNDKIIRQVMSLLDA